MLSAGDTAGALRELKAWVDAHPRDRASRQRIGAAVAERAKELEGRGQRELALGLYEQRSRCAASRWRSGPRRSRR
jgi:hypothetical protein